MELNLNKDSKVKTSAEDQIDLMMKQHLQAALQSYKYFQQSLLQSLTQDLNNIYLQLNKQLTKVTKNLARKLKANYISSIDSNTIYFHLENFAKKQYKELQDSVQKLKLRIYQYLNQFSFQILQKNIKRTNQISLFHTSNRINGFFTEWYSVSTRSPIFKAEIIVNGFNRPTTTWLALGVSKNKKQYGLVKKSLTYQDFTGNIYLNGSDSLSGKQEKYRMKRDLQNGDVFVIQNINRMISVYRKSRGKAKDQIFILDDNTEYYFYVAFKGPLALQFHAF